VGSAQPGVEVVVELGFFKVGYQYGPVAGRTQHLVPEVQARKQALIAERADGRVILLGFAWACGGEHVHDTRGNSWDAAAGPAPYPPDFMPT
jgi:hypothetical protein